MQIPEYELVLNDRQLPMLQCAWEWKETISAHINAGIVVDFLIRRYSINTCAEEYVYMLALSARGIIGIFEISHGYIDGACCTPRSVIIRALLCNATQVVIVHNHPSGNSKPSSADYKVHRELVQACALFDLELADFIIIGKDYYSFKEQQENRSAA